MRIAGRDWRLRALADRVQAEDPMFGELWPAGVALAGHLAGLAIAKGARVLEAACGLALSSLVLKSRGIDVTATDRNPAAGEFLAANAEINGLPAIAFREADWIDADLGAFDLIVGADLLYERGQPEQIVAFLARHAAPGARIVIADPGRRQLAEFRQRMAPRWQASTEAHFAPRGHILTFA